MNESKRLQTYKEFWPFYVSQHLHKTNRQLHFIGTTGVLICVALAATVSWPLILCGLIAALFVWAYSRSNRQPRYFYGHACALLTLATLGLAYWPLLCAALISGYGFSWFGHTFFEKNRPATFSYPLWSLMGDFQMYWFVLRGKMDAEVERVKALLRKSENLENLS